MLQVKIQHLYTAVLHKYIIYCIVRLIVINADSFSLGSLVRLNTHFVFLVCVVYMLYYICNFVCCVLF